MGNQYSDAAFWAVDGNHDRNDALTWSDQLDDRTHRVTSIGTLVRACQQFVIHNSRAIDFLLILGHGTSGYQAIGAGRHLEHSGTRSLWYQSIVPYGTSHLIGGAEHAIRAPNGVLTEDATIMLASCSVGEGFAGDGLLTTVSTILKVRSVQAYENSVYRWTGMLAGSLKTAFGSDLSSEWAVTFIG